MCSIVLIQKKIQYYSSYLSPVSLARIVAVAPSASLLDDPTATVLPQYNLVSRKVS